MFVCPRSSSDVETQANRPITLAEIDSPAVFEEAVKSPTSQTTQADPLGLAPIAVEVFRVKSPSDLAAEAVPLGLASAAEETISELTVQAVPGAAPATEEAVKKLDAAAQHNKVWHSRISRGKVSEHRTALSKPLPLDLRNGLGVRYLDLWVSRKV